MNVLKKRSPKEHRMVGKVIGVFCKVTESGEVEIAAPVKLIKIIKCIRSDVKGGRTGENSHNHIG